MSLGICFWVLMIVALVFSGVCCWNNGRFMGMSLLIWVLFALVGYRVFGPPIHG